MIFEGYRPVMRFPGQGSAGIWNGVWRNSESGETRLWRLCRYREGWRGWELDWNEHSPLKGQYFRTRRELQQMIDTYLSQS